jgi:hypothetical protein
VELDAGRANRGISRTGDRDIFPALTNPGFVKCRFALQPWCGFGERDPGIHPAVENRAAPFQEVIIGFMIIDGCGAVVGSDHRTPHRSLKREPRNVPTSAPVIPALAEGDTVDPNQKTMMVECFVAAFAKAARVSDVPEEAITSDTREPSYMFLAAEWNRSTVSERAYLLAMLFGREFEVEANDFSLQIAGLAMMRVVEPDGSAAFIARADLTAADGGTRTGAAD